ncbi:hypothetical protein BDW62DRAFT_106132 [Aspergillus aurantiobrunneus]
MFLRIFEPSLAMRYTRSSFVSTQYWEQRPRVEFEVGSHRHGIWCGSFISRLSPVCLGKSRPLYQRWALSGHYTCVDWCKVAPKTSSVDCLQHLVEVVFPSPERESPIAVIYNAARRSISGLGHAHYYLEKKQRKPSSVRCSSATKGPSDSGLIRSDRTTAPERGSTGTLGGKSEWFLSAVDDEDEKLVVGN